MNRLSVLLLSLAFAAVAAAGERGRPLVEVFDAQELGGGHLNESLIELADGRIAVGNIGGVLMYDGARWRMTNHPDMLGGLDPLTTGPDGRILAGFNGDIGAFAEDGAGALVWESLRERLAEADRSSGAMIAVDYDSGRDGYWYLTATRLFFVPRAGGEIQVHVNNGIGVFARFVAGDYWVQDTLGGLQRIAGMSPLRLEPVPGREVLGEGKYIRSLISDNDEWKLAMADGRLYRYRAGAFLPWAEPLWPTLARSKVFCLLRLRDGRIALGAGEHGPLLLDQAGTVVERFDREDGVPARATKAMLEDRMGGLWLAQDLTVVRIDLARGISLYDEDRGLPSAYSLKRWRGELFVGAGTGLFRMSPTPGAGGGRFERVLPNLRNAKSLAVIDADGLLVASAGVHLIGRDERDDLRVRTLYDAPQIFQLIESRFVRGRAWVAEPGRVLRIDRTGPGQFEQTPLTGVDWPIYSISEADADTLWLADRAGGVWRASVGGAHPLMRLTAADGVPEGVVRLYPRRGQGVWFATSLGLRVFNDTSRRLDVPAGVPVEMLDRRIFSMMEDQDDNLWIRGDELTDVALREGNGYRWDRHSLRAVSDLPTVFDFVREDDVVWVLRSNGAVRIDLAARRELPALPVPLFASVDDLAARRPVQHAALAALPADVRNLRLNFALPTPFRGDLSSYRSRLSGFDADWSAWSREAQRDYTNLPDGRFQFEIEARDVFARVSRPAPVALAIAPPWWRSWPARLAYVGAALIALWLAARWGARRRQRQLLIRQRELEAMVEQRTQELRDSANELGRKNAQLADQAERLTEVDRLKTHFFINVGHEFRTPLTLVLGPIDDLLRDTRERFSAHAREQLEMANRNARRVLDLIVELLDVNRFEHGQMRLTRVPTDLQVLARRVLAESAPLLERHGHEARLLVPEDGAWIAAVDPVQIERCIGNLISNAAKYMARGGAIELSLQRAGDEIGIALADQGRGIAAAALAHVFDRFFQAEGSDSASGYGIGLALVREIIEAHDGRVAVESTPGVGSRFTLTLPALTASAVANARVDTESSSAAAPASSDESGAADVLARPLVLVVDDHDDLRARARGLLADRFDVIEANDGPSAWNLVRDRLPDLIVCDVMMPGFDGIELTRRLRADAETAAIAVLLLTAKVGSEHATAGLRAGADDYLAKPFDASELLARIDALLARAQRLRLRLAREAQPMPHAPASESAEQRWRRRLDEQVALHLDDAGFSIEQLADAMHADRSQLFRKCKELLGQSPSEYLRDTRLKRAHDLLEQGAGSISEVAYATGFDSLSSFTRAFKTRYALPPSQISKRRAG